MARVSRDPIFRPGTLKKEIILFHSTSKLYLMDEAGMTKYEGLSEAWDMKCDQ